MEKKALNKQTSYPWKSFLIFLGLYTFGLIMHYPVLLEQAHNLREIIGEAVIANPNQFALNNLFQPFLLGMLAIYFGHRYAKKVKLRSLINEQVKGTMDPGTAKKFTLKDSLPFVISIASVIAIVELGFDVVFQHWLPEVFQPQFILPTIPQALSSVFYVGMGQEILLRFGIMTSIIYILSSKGKNLTDWHYTVGIIFTAVLFAFAQFSGLSGFVSLSGIVILRILVLTGLAGILYGWLYATFHIEAAILSHLLVNSLVIFGNSIIVGLSAL